MSFSFDLRMVMDRMLKVAMSRAAELSFVLFDNTAMSKASLLQVLSLS